MNRAIWQISGGPASRAYAEVFLRHGVALIAETVGGSQSTPGTRERRKAIDRRDVAGGAQMTEDSMNKKKRMPEKPLVKAKKHVYTLEIALLTGPITKKFARKNRTITRTIEARGGHTLADLHGAIFDAFDRYEEHLYEFQIGGKRPMDPKARRYGPAMGMVDPFGETDGSADAEKTTLDSLGLATGDVFGYWFDFGDDWWHQIGVLAIAEGSRSGGPPKLTRRIGESPPQYADLDE